jgi:molybdopterin-guanine dinucleotide biosynthesis protein B
MPIIAVVGETKSGKITVLEEITQGLTKKGYRVATARNIPETDFTIATKDKDTWRHAEAGAKTVLSVAPNELAIIKRVDTTKYDLNDFVKNLREDEVDVLILDGFRKLVTVTTAKRADEALRHFEPILLFAAPTKLNIKNSRIPKIDALKEPEKLIEIADRRIGSIIEKRRTSKEALKIQVNEKTLPLNPFVHKFIRNVVLAMISTLKETAIKGDEDVFIEIKQTRKKYLRHRKIFSQRS